MQRFLRKTMLPVWLILCLCILTACGNEITTTRNIPTPEITVCSMNGSISEVGRLYFDYKTSLMTLYDFGSKSNIRICGDVNCKHNSSECSAYFSFTETSAYAFYDSSILFWRSTDVLTTQLCKCNLDGTNRTVIYEDKQGKIPIPDNGTTYCKDAVYFGYAAKQADVNDVLASRVQLTPDSIAKIDLKTGKLTVLTMPAENGHVFLSNCDGEYLYYSMSRDAGAENYTVAYYQLNLETNEISMVLNDDTVDHVCFGDRKCAYYRHQGGEKNLYLLDLETNEEKELYASENLCTLYFLDGKLFFYDLVKVGPLNTYTEYYYDFETGEITENANELPDTEVLWPKYVTSELIVGQVGKYDTAGNQLDNILSVWITKEDFYNGRSNYTEIGWE